MLTELTTKALHPAEKAFKKYFLDAPTRHLDQPCTEDQIVDILHDVFVNCYPDSEYGITVTVNEHTFVSSDLDAAFVRHLRYLPALIHQHDFFELLYVAEGRCTNTILQQSISMAAGDLCIIAPGTEHAVSAFEDEDIIFNIIIRTSTFESAFFGLLEGDDILSDFFRRTFYGKDGIPWLLFHTAGDTHLLEVTEHAYEEYQSHSQYRKQMMNSMLSVFLITLLRDHEETMEIPNAHLYKTDNNLMSILRYMQANFATVSMAEMAKQFNYSERQLQRLILNATGMTFRENIQKQKMSRAALLLRRGVTVTEICQQLGFESENNFRKIFARAFGMTPSDYRKQQTSAQDGTGPDSGFPSA